MLVTFVAVALLPLLCFALPSTSPLARRVHERRSSLPPSWSPSTPPHPFAPLPFRIGLKQSNMDKAHDELMRISDPSSPDFANHWTAKQVAEFFAPTTDSVETVIAWLEAEGVERSRVKHTQSLGWLDVADVTVAEAERLLDTEYTVYEHVSNGDLYLGCNEYSLPEHVSGHVDFVTPTLKFHARERSELLGRNFGTMKAPHRTISTLRMGPAIGPSISHSVGSSELVNCSSEFIVPACLQALYKMPFDKQSATAKNSFGIMEFTPESFLPSDLDVFFEKFVPQAVGRRPTVDSIDGGYELPNGTESGYFGEASLDVQYSMALIYPLDPVVYQVGDGVQNNSGSWNNFLDALDASYCTFDGGDDPAFDGIYPDPAAGGYQGPENCGGYTAANVISISYGEPELEAGTPAYLLRQCNEYLKLGLQGKTILFSSGDYGVGTLGYNATGYSFPMCFTPDGETSVDGTVFIPQFPASCPYITAVGGTQIKSGATVYEPEEAAIFTAPGVPFDGYSGGGFSNVFPVASYQEKTIRDYYANYRPPYSAAQYNNSMMVRGYPDISSNGNGYMIAFMGDFYPTSGTSCSTPVVASIIALVNDARLAVGKKPVGFVNPTLYANPWVLNDITSGGNPGCGTSGFKAVPGWDPVTGLGTPDYEKLVTLYLGLP